MNRQAKLTHNSLNVRGSSKKRQTLFQWIKRNYHGITMLKETHSTVESETIWQQQWGYKIIFNHGTSNN